MRSLNCLMALGLLVTSWSFGGVADGGTVTYITPTNAYTSNATWPSGGRYGIAFKTGLSGPFGIDFVDIGLNTSGVTGGGPVTMTVALNNTDNETPYSAVAGTTVYAQDTVSFLMPTTGSTYFTANLTSAQLPNITAFQMQSATAYALVVTNPR